RQYQYDARRQQGDGGGVFGDSQFTSTLSVNFHFPKIPRRTKNNRRMTIEESRPGATCQK
ncbi:hypothetical protein ACET70_07295, partial [Aeromonas caviae]|uniref:hypothetical protein n=2 Tax=Aeromonadaceae TaxID=84642 RepID=UPI0038CFB943